VFELDAAIRCLRRAGRDRRHLVKILHRWQGSSEASEAFHFAAIIVELAEPGWLDQPEIKNVLPHSWTNVAFWPRVPTEQTLPESVTTLIAEILLPDRVEPIDLVDYALMASLIEITPSDTTVHRFLRAWLYRLRSVSEA
jgi:hypothetical protein